MSAVDSDRTARAKPFIYLYKANDLTPYNIKQRDETTFSIKRIRDDDQSEVFDIFGAKKLISSTLPSEAAGLNKFFTQSAPILNELGEGNLYERDPRLILLAFDSVIEIKYNGKSYSKLKPFPSLPLMAREHALTVLNSQVGYFKGPLV
jgi:hypothetical protein